MPYSARSLCTMRQRVGDDGGESGRRLFSDGPIEDLGPADGAAGKPVDAHQTIDTDSLGERFEVSEDLRMIAEKRVEQARQAFEGLLDAAHRFVGMLGGPSESAGKGAKGVADRAMGFVERDIANSFEFAQKLMRADNVQDVLKLQADYIKARMQLLSSKS